MLYQSSTTAQITRFFLISYALIFFPLSHLMRKLIATLCKIVNVGVNLKIKSTKVLTSMHTRCDQLIHVTGEMRDDYQSSCYIYWPESNWYRRDAQD